MPKTYEPEAPRLSKESIQRFDAVINKAEPLALMSGFLETKDGSLEVPIVCHLENHGTHVHMTPIYIHVTDALALLLRNSDREPTEARTNPPRS